MELFEFLCKRNIHALFLFSSVSRSPFRLSKIIKLNRFKLVISINVVFLLSHFFSLILRCYVLIYFFGSDTICSWTTNPKWHLFQLPFSIILYIDFLLSVMSFCSPPSPSRLSSSSFSRISSKSKLSTAHGVYYVCQL